MELLMVTVAETHQLARPPPTPGPGGGLPVLPEPPTARLWASVRLLAIKEVPRARFHPSLVMAPPRPQPTMKAPLPPVLSFPPRASLCSKELSVTVAVALSRLMNPPPLPSPTWPRPKRAIAWEPPTAWLWVNVLRQITAVPEKLATPPP